MTRTELIQRIVENHNRIVKVEVSGENTILVAETLIDLRNLVKQLQNEPIEEEN